MSDRHPREFPTPGDHSRAMPEPTSLQPEAPQDESSLDTSPTARRDERGRVVPARPDPARRDAVKRGEALWRELIAELTAEEASVDGDPSGDPRSDESLIEAILALGPVDAFGRDGEGDPPIEDLPLGGGFSSSREVDASREADSSGETGGDSSSGTETQTDTDTGVDEHVESRLARRYRVIVHNDSVTPMDFVVRVLTGVFRLGVEHAIEVMLEAHRADCALVRAFGLEEAEFRVQRSHSLARSRSYPLTFTIEPE